MPPCRTCSFAAVEEAFSVRKSLWTSRLGHPCLADKMISNVGITIINHPLITIDSWYVHHSQSWVVYGIVIPTLWVETMEPLSYSHPVGPTDTPVEVYHTMVQELLNPSQ